MDTTSSIDAAAKLAVEDYGLTINVISCDEGYTFTFTKPATATTKGWANSFTRTYGVTELDVDADGELRVYPKTKAAAKAAAERFRKWFNLELHAIKTKAAKQRFIPSQLEAMQLVTSEKVEHKDPMLVSILNANF
jgi:hypothetical protein